jgi:hypothetical protein
MEQAYGRLQIFGKQQINRKKWFVRFYLPLLRGSRP